MAESMNRSEEFYKKAAQEFLRHELRSFHGNIKEVLSDYRCMSVPGDANLYCEIGGLYTTTPEKPGTHVAVKSMGSTGILARFKIEELI